jgi:hypothetical protein
MSRLESVRCSTKDEVNVLSSSSEAKSKPSKQEASTKLHPKRRWISTWFQSVTIQRNFLFSMALQPFDEDFSSFLSFLILYRVGKTPWTGDQPVARPLRTHKTTQTEYRTQTSMLWVWFEPTIPVCERAKTVHSLDHAATLIGTEDVTLKILLQSSTTLQYYLTAIILTTISMYTRYWATTAW